ncbi:MAG TPA: hypothetical protein VED59_06450, partial [Acidimicrobiales bacterium]|nr:hypothetical protein [Acidimicrobiales bacterium]
MALEDRPDAGRGELDAEARQFAVHPAVAPCRVLSGYAEHKGGGTGGHRRPAARTVLVRPAPADEVAVPAKQGRGLDEWVHRAPVGEQPPKASQEGPVGRPQ